MLNPAVIEVLDLFSAAAGGWSLGMHRAGFTTMAACEVEAWRRALYSENNPNTKVYDDVRTLTADRLLADLGRLPSVVVGSPPCQDISSANTKGRGVEGERSGLYFEAVRLIGECRPRWFALENSANLRTRGADAVVTALEAIGYACWPCVVRAGDDPRGAGAGVGANHERERCWLIGADLDQVADTAVTRHAGWGALRSGREARDQYARDHDASCIRSVGSRGAANADQARQAHGRVEPSLRQTEIADDGRGARWSNDRSGSVQVGVCAPDRNTALGRRADWSLADLADHLRLDDGLSTRLAGHRVDIGNGKGQSAASLIVEAFGDAVIPQIPEAIGRAILRTERALSEIYGRAAA
ncbi:DNA cytosine methyltransferase [Sphingomonas sp. PAMC26645]|nr:DNA cytosine methyltransferase [Sphingomonas sp. PAMC26645]